MFPYQFFTVGWPMEPSKKHKLTRPTSADRQWEFADQFSIQQTPSLSMIVQSFGVLDAQAVLRDERITGVDPPLLVKRRDATAAAIGNHITNPLRIQRPCSRATFTTRY